MPPTHLVEHAQIKAGAAGGVASRPAPLRQRLVAAGAASHVLLEGAAARPAGKLCQQQVARGKQAMTPE